MKIKTPPPKKATSLKQLRANVQKRFQLADKSIKNSGRLIGAALETPPGDINAIDSALNQSHQAFLLAQSSLIQYSQLLKMLESNKDFMADDQNKDGLVELKKLSTMGEGIMAQCKQAIIGQERSLKSLSAVAKRTEKLKP